MRRAVLNSRAASPSGDWSDWRTVWLVAEHENTDRIWSWREPFTRLVHRSSMTYTSTTDWADTVRVWTDPEATGKTDDGSTIHYPARHSILAWRDGVGHPVLDISIKYAHDTDASDVSGRVAQQIAALIREGKIA